MKNHECKCDGCVRACKMKPGWFMPGEAEILAENMGMTLQELFNQHLGVDWWNADEEIQEDVFVLAPANIHMDTGGEYPKFPEGQCKFLVDGLCTIHEKGKPFECVALNHVEEYNHADTAKAWNKPEHQAQIEMLLGRKPEAKILTMMDVLFGGDEE